MTIMPIDNEPERLCGLLHTVGREQHNAPGDVAMVETLLEKTQALDTRPTEGPTGFFGRRLEEGIRGFQKSRGLKRDGFLNPGGETIRALLAEALPGVARTPGIAAEDARKPHKAPPGAIVLVPERRL